MKQQRASRDGALRSDDLGKKDRSEGRYRVMRLAQCMLPAILMGGLAGCASMAWKDATTANTIPAYERFLAQHSQSEFDRAAREKLEKLYYDQAKTSNTVESYERFIARYSTGSLCAAAKTRIAAIKEEKRKKAEAERVAAASQARAARDRLSQDFPPDQAWRKEPEVFVKSITRIANEAKRPESKDITFTDGITVLQDKSGQTIWLGKHAGDTNELHGALAAAFTGEVMWPCKVKSAHRDEEKGLCTLQVYLPSAGPLPKGMELLGEASVSLPMSALPSGFTPSPGDSVTIIGELKDGPSDGVWVAYGVRTNEGKTMIMVNLSGLSLEKR